MSPSGPIDWSPMVVGFIAGFLSRVISIKSGRSHYPGYPSGYISQIALAIIAAIIGSSIIVSLVGKQFTAATFLTLAATQFRDVRSTERTTLEKEESLILVSRGAGYIEGIAITYEARNYLAMLIALVTSVSVEYLGVVVGAIVGIVAIIVGEIYMSGPHMGDMVDVEPGKIHFEKGTLLYVGDVMMMEVGLPHSRERYLQEGIGVILTPKGPRGQSALWNVSQRQAISHEVAAAVGAQKDVGYPEQTPLCRMDMPKGSGRAALSILPVEHDVEAVIKAIKKTPMLESGKWSAMRSPILNRKELD